MNNLQKTPKRNFINFQITNILLTFFAVPLFSVFFVLSADAQENIIKDIVPPPLPIISKVETNQLQSEADIKKRTKLSIDLMENRLEKAESFSTAKNYQQSLDELGGFQAIMSDAVKYLAKKDSGSGKVLNNFKRFEINLRSFVPRLELVRRMMPEKFSYHVTQLMKLVRKTRSNAVENLFDDNVVKGNK